MDIVKYKERKEFQMKDEGQNTVLVYERDECNKYVSFTAHIYGFFEVCLHKEHGHPRYRLDAASLNMMDSPLSAETLEEAEMEAMLRISDYLQNYVHVRDYALAVAETHKERRNR